MSQDSAPQAPAAPATSVLGVSFVAEEFQDVLWMLIMLTATGVAVGLVVWKAPAPAPAAGRTVRGPGDRLGGRAARHGGRVRLPVRPRRLRPAAAPMLMFPLGGLVLGLLGALGGHLALFNGLEEIGEPAADREGWSAGECAGMAVGKPAALLVAAGCGFRGGRIFPAVFVGASLGLCAHALVPDVHPAAGVAAGVLGVLLAGTRQGWVSLFIAAVPVSSPLDPRPVVHRVAARLAAGDRAPADAVARGGSPVR